MGEGGSIFGVRPRINEVLYDEYLMNIFRLQLKSRAEIGRNLEEGPFERILDYILSIFVTILKTIWGRKRPNISFLTQFNLRFVTSIKFRIEWYMT